MAAKARMAAIVLTLAGLLGSAPAVATAATASAGTAHHAVVAATWTKAHAVPAKDTWT